MHVTGQPMVKTKNPLLSLGARGSIAGTHTYQRAHRTDYVRRKVAPTDPRSDRQLWRRYLYLQACHYWNTLTPEQKAAWRSAGSKYHLTGFSFFIRFELNRLRSLMLALPLDEGKGTIATDFSSYSNYASLFNCLWVDGVIGSAVAFNGTNSYANCGNDLTLKMLPGISSYTIEFWCYPYIMVPAPDWGYHFWSRLNPRIGMWKGNQKLNIYQNHDFYSVAILPWMTWTHVIVIIYPTPAQGIDIYLGGDLDSHHTWTGDWSFTDTDLILGAMNATPTNPLKGWMDEPRFYSCALTPEECKRHAERR